MGDLRPSDVRYELHQGGNRFWRPATPATLGGNSEATDMAACGNLSPPGPFHPILKVDQAKVKFALWRKPQLGKRRKIGVIVSGDGDWHVNPIDQAER